MSKQLEAILWAQFRMLRNYFPRAGRGGLVFWAIISLAWYGMWAALATLAFRITYDTKEPRTLELMLSGGFLLVFLYWQLIPVLMATTGASLDMRKLLAYPIEHGQLFGIDVALRLSTGLEMLFLLTGTGLGLLANRWLPKWAPFWILPYILFNLFFASGTREVLARIFAKRRTRELGVLFLVLCGAVPQALVLSGIKAPTGRLVEFYNAPWLPWGAASRLAQGQLSIIAVVSLVAWVAVAYAFGRWQFERSLQFDQDAARSTEEPSRSRESWFDVIFRWPRAMFKDPLAALVEKELRFLARAPRFRLVFSMGFTFGLIIWLPIAMRGGQGSGLGGNYLTLVCVYALLLLGDVCFWNTFGFDRRAAQFYFVSPVRFSTVLIAKNINAAFWILLEITLIIGVCALLRMPMSAAKLAEAYLVTAVVSMFLLAAGNLTSTHNGRGVNPDRSLRTGAAGQMQAFLVLVYPLAGIPVGLAYAARYAFRSDFGFYAVLAVDAVIAAIVYSVAMDSAVAAAERKRETLVDRLSQGEGLVQA